MSGEAALHVHATGITDYAAVCRALASDVAAAGGEVRTSTAVTGIAERSASVDLTLDRDGWESVEATRLVILCGGLQADRLAAMSGLNSGEDAFSIVPFRGEYFRLPESRDDLVDALIYPVPDPDLPFLGVHLTRMIDGGITVGPNAVLGLSREGYRKGSVDVRDVASLGGVPRHVARGAHPLAHRARRAARLLASQRLPSAGAALLPRASRSRTSCPSRPAYGPRPSCATGRSSTTSSCAAPSGRCTSATPRHRRRRRPSPSPGTWSTSRRPPHDRSGGSSTSLPASGRSWSSSWR